MIRLKYHPPGTAPATIPTPEAGNAKPTTVTLIKYSEETIEEVKVKDFADLLARLEPEKVNWINIDGLADVGFLHELAAHFKIHPLALEDAIVTSQRPKVEQFGEQFFIITEMIYAENAGRIAVEQLSMFLEPNYLITLQEEPGQDVFDPIRARLRSGRGYSRKRGADYLAYALLDATVDQFFPLLEDAGDAIAEIEEALMEKPGKGTLKQLYQARRFLLMLRRAAWPQREIFSTLMRDEGDLITKETKVFLRDCYDHSTQIIDILENYRELATGLMDVYLSSLGFRTNEIMRVLTLVSVFFMPLTFIAGVYGMNFNTDHPLNMPELNWPFGYIYFWLICTFCLAGMLVFFKRKHWL